MAHAGQPSHFPTSTADDTTFWAQHHQAQARAALVRQHQSEHARRVRACADAWARREAAAAAQRADVIYVGTVRVDAAPGDASQFVDTDFGVLV